jgi:HAE1 family hydrophobic/amphiphilic exporter-1
VPSEDQGIIIGIVQAPDGVSVSYTDRALEYVIDTLKDTPKSKATLSASGSGLEGAGPNQGLFFAKLKHWDERTGERSNVNGVLHGHQSNSLPRTRRLAFSL